MNWFRRHRGESGAVAVMMALVISLVLIPLAAFAVDIGMQRVARKDAQAVADTTALNMATTLGSSGAASVTNAAALTSAKQNGGVLGNDMKVVAYTGTLSSAYSSNQALGCGGAGTAYNDYFTPTASGSAPNAVLVVVRNKVDFNFVGGSGGVCRSAIASTQPSACYKADSFALGLATKDSVLRGLLGPAAALRVLSNSGIASANVSLLGIATKLGVGTPQELVNLPHLTVGQFLDAAASVLNDQGDTASADLATQLLGLKTDLGPVAGATAPLSQLIDLGQGGGTALDAGINVFDIVTGAAEVANGTNAIDVSGLAVNLGLANVTASLYVTKPGNQACNGGTSTATQGYIKLTGDLGSCNKLLSVLCTSIALTVSLANASAKQSANWACSTDKLTLSVFNQTLAGIRLQADVKQYVLGILLHVASVDTGLPGVGPTKDYDLPLPDSYSPPGVETSSGGLGLSLAGADVTLLGAVSLGPVLSLLNPLVSAVTNNLVPSLLDTLGLTVDGADLVAMPKVSCTSPKLVG